MKAELVKLTSRSPDAVDTSSLPSLSLAHGLLTEQQGDSLQTLKRLRDLIETVGRLDAGDRFVESTTYIGMVRKFLQVLMKSKAARPRNSHGRRG